MSDQDESRQVFAQEAEELLGDMEDALLLMEEAPDDAEHINRVFRAMHTVKGAAGVFGFLPIVTFAHPVETNWTGYGPVNAAWMRTWSRCCWTAAITPRSWSNRCWGPRTANRRPSW